MLYTVSKRMEISAAHHLDLDYESPCSNWHGHNWIITVYVCGNHKNNNGMLIDFKQIKTLIHDKLDHKVLNEVLDFNPTAENIGAWVMLEIRRYLEDLNDMNSPTCYKVEVQESEGNVATVYAENAPIYQVLGNM